LSYAPAQKGRLQNGEPDYNIVHEPRRTGKRSIQRIALDRAEAEKGSTGCALKPFMIAARHPWPLEDSIGWHWDLHLLGIFSPAVFRLGGWSPILASAARSEEQR